VVKLKKFRKKVALEIQLDRRFGPKITEKITKWTIGVMTFGKFNTKITRKMGGK